MDEITLGRALLELNKRIARLPNAIGDRGNEYIAVVLDSHAKLIAALGKIVDSFDPDARECQSNEFVDIAVAELSRIEGNGDGRT